MTEIQISNSIRSGVPFFGVAENKTILARYVPFGPVFQWKQGMLPTPLQGEDLLWWLKVSGEEGGQD